MNTSINPPCYSNFPFLVITYEFVVSLVKIWLRWFKRKCLNDQKIGFPHQSVVNHLKPRPISIEILRRDGLEKVREAPFHTHTHTHTHFFFLTPSPPFFGYGFLHQILRVPSGTLLDIVACHLPRGSKLWWREDIGEGLPSMRKSRIKIT